jgi:hypothetical protein
MARSGSAVARTEAPVQTVATSAAVSPAELSALEQKVLERMRAELDARAPVTSGAVVPRAAADSRAEASDLVRRVNVLSNRQDELYGLLLDFASQTDGIRLKQSGLERDQRMLVSYMQGGTTGIPGGQ